MRTQYSRIPVKETPPRFVRTDAMVVTAAVMTLFLPLSYGTVFPSSMLDGNNIAPMIAVGKFEKIVTTSCEKSRAVESSMIPSIIMAPSVLAP